MYLYLSESTRIYKSYNKILIYYHDNQDIFLEENESGLEILLLCDGTRTKNQIIFSICNHYTISDQNIISEIEKYINQHMQSGLIKQKKKLELKTIYYRENPEIISPCHMSLEITNTCNLRCNHCFNNSNINSKKFLEFNKIKEIIDVFNSIGIPLIYLTGGEPFTHPDIKKILSYVNNKFISITIATNAYNISPYLDDIIAIKNCSIQVSLDGLEEKHNSIRGKKDAFQKTIEGIKMLTVRNISVCIYFTLNQDNDKDLEDVVSLAKDIGCKAFKIAAVLSIGRAKKNQLDYDVGKDYSKVILELAQKYNDNHFMILNDQLKNNSITAVNNRPYPNKCGAGYDTLYIKADGDVTMCATMQEIVFGNINTDSLQSLLKPTILDRAKNIPSPCREICGTCQYLDSCNGCIARIFEHNESECKLRNEYKI